jgi:hypothetical protein
VIQKHTVFLDGNIAFRVWTSLGGGPDASFRFLIPSRSLVIGVAHEKSLKTTDNVSEDFVEKKMQSICNTQQREK